VEGKYGRKQKEKRGPSRVIMSFNIGYREKGTKLRGRERGEGKGAL